jgi:hypothetical protein
MIRNWILVPAFVLVPLSSVQAQPAAAAVAVMPVQGVNLTEGQCDAIGVLFANAFAREANVVVASSVESKQALQHSKTSLEAARQLGAFEYVELRAIQLAARVSVAGIRYAKDGGELFRAETAAANLDDMDMAMARLARALAWRQPIPGSPIAGTGAPSSVPIPASETKAYPNASGIKTGLIFPMASGRSISPMMSLQFDGRVGTRDYFIEYGAGAAVPTDTQSNSNTIQMGGVFAEIGGSVYLSDGNVAPYVGGGVSPRIWEASNSGNENGGGARCALFGQLGLTFTRDIRARIYVELRVAQNVIGFANQANVTNSGYVAPTTGTYYPTEFALQFGIGW